MSTRGRGETREEEEEKMCRSHLNSRTLALPIAPATVSAYSPATTQQSAPLVKALSASSVANSCGCSGASRRQEPRFEKLRLPRGTAGSTMRRQLVPTAGLIMPLTARSKDGQPLSLSQPAGKKRRASSLLGQPSGSSLRMKVVNSR